MIVAVVQQGTVLGPVLYTIFTSEIPQPGPGAYIALFADDAELISATRDQAVVGSRLCKGLQKSKTGLSTGESR